ncbi:hypothetical protein ACFL6U_13635 [Planctomycetota bacterium]
MWNTPHGKRILKGPEANLFAEGLLTLIDDSSTWDFEDYPMGINAYDHLTPGQQISALRTIAMGLLSSEAKLIKPTAALEGAIATVFRQIEDRLEVELEDPEAGTGWRKMINAVRKEAGADDLLSEDCDDFDAWQLEIERIEDNILWDNDFDTSDLTMDLPPEQAQFIKESMGIPDEYIQTIPDDLNENQMKAAITELRELYAHMQE